MVDDGAVHQWCGQHTRYLGRTSADGRKLYQAEFVSAECFKPGAAWNEVTITFWTLHPRLVVKHIYRHPMTCSALMALNGMTINPEGV